MANRFLTTVCHAQIASAILQWSNAYITALLVVFPGI
jgi:hypothetical protein